MRVFVLSTGRCGSMTFAKACEFIENYTCGHETRTRIPGNERLNYKDYHIESDNRLSWLLGDLDSKFGDDAFYVHLKRNENKVAESYSSRIHEGSIIKAYYESIHMGCGNDPDVSLATPEELYNVSLDYVRKTNKNIELFLKDKKNKLTINIETISEQYQDFWELIGAKGDFDASIHSFDIKHNKRPLAKVVPTFKQRILNKFRFKRGL